MSSTDVDVDAYTKPFQLTKSMHRNIYPAIDPANPALKATGKVVIITGAGAGIGCVGPYYNPRPGAWIRRVLRISRTLPLFVLLSVFLIL